MTESPEDCDCEFCRTIKAQWNGNGGGMTVSELIRQLSELDPNLLVLTWHTPDSDRGLVDATDVRVWTKEEIDQNHWSWQDRPDESKAVVIE